MTRPSSRKRPLGGGRAGGEQPSQPQEVPADTTSTKEIKVASINAARKFRSPKRAVSATEKSDPFLGGGQPSQPQAVPADTTNTKEIKVATINVSALRAKRLEDLLTHKEIKDVDILCLQEVRLHSSKPGWVSNIALKLGWRVLCSAPPEVQPNGMVKHGGTAILWKASIGNVATHRSSSHRYVAIRSNFGTFGSAYGPASEASAPWIEEVMDWTEDVARDSSEGWALVGDLNWRKCYADHLSEDQKLCDMVKPTTLVDTWPTRMVTRRMKARHLDSIAVPGIPHHCLTIFNVSIQSEPNQHSGNEKKAAEFSKKMPPFFPFKSMLPDSRGQPILQATLARTSLKAMPRNSRTNSIRCYLSFLIMPLCPIGGNSGMPGQRRRSKQQREKGGSTRHAKESEQRARCRLFAESHPSLPGDLKSPSC